MHPPVRTPSSTRTAPHGGYWHPVPRPDKTTNEVMQKQNWLRLRLPKSWRADGEEVALHKFFRSAADRSIGPVC